MDQVSNVLGGVSIAGDTKKESERKYAMSIRDLRLAPQGPRSSNGRASEGQSTVENQDAHREGADGRDHLSRYFKCSKTKTGLPKTWVVAGHA